MALRYKRGSKVSQFGITIRNNTDYIYWSGITMYWEFMNDDHTKILSSKSFVECSFRFENMESNLDCLLSYAFHLARDGSEENQVALSRLVAVAYFMVEQAAEHIRTLK